MENLLEKLKEKGNEVLLINDFINKADLELDGWNYEVGENFRQKIHELTNDLDEFSEWNDAAESNNDDEVVFKSMIEKTIIFHTEQLESLSQTVGLRLEAFAEKKKNLGNDEFKKGRFPAALELYDEAIDCDPTNAILYTNKALVYMKMGDWMQALSDAEHAVTLDMDMLKGHIIVIKCQVTNYSFLPL